MKMLFAMQKIKAVRFPNYLWTAGKKDEGQRKTQACQEKEQVHCTNRSLGNSNSIQTSLLDTDLSNILTIGL